MQIFFRFLYDMTHDAGWEPYSLHDLAHVPGLGLYHANPAQPLPTAGEELVSLDHDLQLCEEEA